MDSQPPSMEEIERLENRCRAARTPEAVRRTFEEAERIISRLPEDHPDAYRIREALEAAEMVRQAYRAAGRW